MTSSFHPQITVSEVVARAPRELGLRVIAGERGLTRPITIPRVQKLGLALAGFAHYVHRGRVQIIGQSEIQFLDQLSSGDRRRAIANLPLEDITCVLVTKGLMPPSEFLEVAERQEIPVLVSTLVSSQAIVKLTEFLQRQLAPRQWVHGVMVELFGLGVILLGESGLGKSECALDLILRGHRLVADDIIEIRAVASDRLIGLAPERVRQHIEIRGLGILNIKDIFGVVAIAEEAPVDLAIEFERWDRSREYDRLGMADETVQWLGVHVPLLRIPVSAGRNLTTLVEVAVRAHLLKRQGLDAMRRFIAEHDDLVRSRPDVCPAPTDGESPGASSDG
jgi:HPr kinase/phosphorylase